MSMTRKTFISSAAAAALTPNLFAGAKRVVKVGAVGCGWRGSLWGQALLTVGGFRRALAIFGKI